MRKVALWILTGACIVCAIAFSVITIAGVVWMVLCEGFGMGSECGFVMLAVVPALAMAAVFSVLGTLGFNAGRKA
jgi:hypothetical protein